MMLIPPASAVLCRRLRKASLMFLFLIGIDFSAVWRLDSAVQFKQRRVFIDGNAQFFWGGQTWPLLWRRGSLLSLFPDGMGAVKNVDREGAMGKYVGK